MIYMLAGPTTDRAKPGETPKVPSGELIEAFYSRMGKAIAAWQFIEWSLVIIFVRAIGGGNLDAIADSYYASGRSFAARLRMVEAAVEGSHFGADLKAKWKELSRKLKNESSNRNKMAHAIVMFMPRSPPHRQLFLSTKVDPMPRPTPIRPENTVTQKDLDQMIAAFGELHNELTMFHIALPVFAPLPREAQEAS